MRPPPERWLDAQVRLIALIMPCHCRDQWLGPNPNGFIGVDGHCLLLEKLSKINALTRWSRSRGCLIGATMPRIGRRLLVAAIGAAGLIFLHRYNELDHCDYQE
jgi:hypothetical protein